MESKKKALNDSVMPTGGIFEKYRYSLFTEKRDQKQLNDQIIEYARLNNKEKKIEQKRS